MERGGGTQEPLGSLGSLSSGEYEGTLRYILPLEPPLPYVTIKEFRAPGFRCWGALGWRGVGAVGTASGL